VGSLDAAINPKAEENFLFGCHVVILLLQKEDPK
jgi:hypothetical protein